MGWPQVGSGQVCSALSSLSLGPGNIWSAPARHITPTAPDAVLCQTGEDIKYG